MVKTTTVNRKHLVLTLTVAYTLLLTVVSLIKISAPTPELNIIGFDKLIHFGLYATLNTLLITTIIAYREDAKALDIAISTISAIIYGTLIEFIQGLVGRDFDMFDIVANSIGAIATALLISCTNIKGLIKRQLPQAHHPLHSRAGGNLSNKSGKSRI